MAYTSITVEGGLFSADLLDRIATGDAAGQREADFDLPGGTRLSAEMQAAFSDMRALWEAFAVRRRSSHDSLTSLTREAWVLPLLERLRWRDGETYALEYQRPANRRPDLCLLPPRGG